jgi:hypothetical protein
MVLTAVLPLALIIGMMISPIGTASATNSISKIQSGLVVSDSLTTGNITNWTFGGTAATHDYYEDSQGLHIGVKSPSSGQWINYYAHLPQPDARLFHTTINIPDTTVADGVSNVGLYVEGSDYIPHVGCEAYADDTGYYWDVEQSSDAGNTYTILYISQPSSMPQTQDCTIITNGSNYLKVFIGSKMVFSSTTMSLGMSTPFIAFVQDDTSSSSAMHYATYSNYYVTANENIKITNNPSNAATAKIVDSSGQVLSSASVTSGTATLNVAKYLFPLAATINVYDSSGSVIASSPASIYGGDVFSVTSTSSAPQPPTSLAATATSTSQINLSWTAPADNGGSPITGYKIERSTNAGSTWSTITPNTASTSTTYSDTGLAAGTSYTYRVSAINAIGTSPPSNVSSATTNQAITTSTLTVSTQDSNRNAITGYYTELDQNGNYVASGFTPYTFTLNNGQTYTVSVNNYGNYQFDHWLDTGSVTASRVISISSNGIITAVYRTIPQSPTGLTATASSSQINLSWTAPADNGGSPITGYKIERSTDAGSTWSTVVPSTASTATTYSDTGLAHSTTYTYRVSAINVVGPSLPSSVSSATTLNIISQPPTGLVATAASSSQINLSWTAPADNGGSPITGYKIERSTDAGSTWSTSTPNTGNTATTYSDTGLVQGTTYTYRVSAINAIGTSSPSNVSSATTATQSHSVTLAQPGLVVSDSLTNETMTKAQLLANQQFWRYGGSATVNNTPFDISRDPQGFHIGVQAGHDGNWTGFYGVAPSSSAVLFHAVVTTPVRSIPTNNDFYENGLYVQTVTQNVNYVTCFADTGTAGTVWAIVSAVGNANGAVNFTSLWFDSSVNQPLTRDCTIITNGQNYLKVYLDGTMVYTSNTLNLQMPGPFISFLEPQTSYAGQMLYGSYKDYYATTDESIKITNNPSNAARVDVTSPSGSVIASGTVTAGTATISVGQYHFPLSGTIKVYDSANNVIASTVGIVNVFGGDVYSVR